MFEPRIFPRASCPFFFAAATTQVTSSGIEVPPARMVTAMNLSLMFSILAIFVALSTNLSPPKIKAANPPRTIRIATHNFPLSGSAESLVSSAFPDLKDQYI